MNDFLYIHVTLDQNLQAGMADEEGLFIPENGALVQELNGV